MKTIILGAKGMLGSDLGRVFYDWRPYLLDLDTLNITNEKAVWDLFHNLKPDLVINAAALTDVDGCETDKEAAIELNGAAPGYLAKASKDVGAIFVQYSTDYVFSGESSSGYAEDDKPSNPASVYGKSKLLGEVSTQGAGGNYYLIRSSWLFGNRGHLQDDRPKNFVETMLHLAKEKEEIKVVNDQHGKPTFTLDLARRTRTIIEEGHDFGIYHITNEPVTTWYEFAKVIISEWGEGKQEKLPQITPCTSGEFPRPAKRPEYSILLNTKLPPMRSWHEALQEYLLSRG